VHLCLPHAPGRADALRWPPPHVALPSGAAGALAAAAAAWGACAADPAAATARACCNPSRVGAWVAEEGGSAALAAGFVGGAALSVALSALRDLLARAAAARAVRGSAERGSSAPALEALVAGGGLALHAASMGGSSAVEEEHSTLYFLATSLSLALVRRALAPPPAPSLAPRRGRSPRRARSASGERAPSGGGEGGWAAARPGSRAETSAALAALALAAAVRVGSGWNQAGVKRAADADVAKWLKREDSAPVRAAAAAAALCLIGAGAGALGGAYAKSTGTPDAGRRGFARVALQAAVPALLAAWLVNERTTAVPQVWAARVIFVGALGVVLGSLRDVAAEGWGGPGGAGATFGLVTLLVPLHHEHNYPLLLLFLAQGACAAVVAGGMRQRGGGGAVEDGVQWELLVLLEWVGRCGFFALGNSNSLATVDISKVYTGLTEYDATLCALFTALITFSAPLVLFLAALTAVDWHAREGVPGTFKTIAVHTAMRVACLAVLCAVAALMRSHLFVWSVFAPKLLYEARAPPALPGPAPAPAPAPAAERLAAGSSLALAPLRARPRAPHSIPAARMTLQRNLDSLSEARRALDQARKLPRISQLGCFWAGRLGPTRSARPPARPPAAPAVQAPAGAARRLLSVRFISFQILFSILHRAPRVLCAARVPLYSGSPR